MPTKIISELEAFGLKYETKTYFLKLSSLLANLYNNYIDPSISYNTTLNETKLDFSHFVISIKDRKYLEYASNDLLIFLDKSSYIIMDLKGNIIKLIINGSEKKLLKKMNYQDIIPLITEKYGLTASNKALENLYERLYLTSLIYNYAYHLLITSKNNLVKAGMFKIAYHDLIQISETKLNSEKNTLHRE